MNQKESDFIDEMKFCIGENDVVKAVALLQFFNSIDAKTQKKVLFEILKAPDKVAFPMLERLTRLDVESEDIKEKINGLVIEKSYENSGLIVDYIKKSDEKNKEIYIEVAGNLKLKVAIPVLEEMLANETNDDILEKVITALGNIGDQTAVPMIGKFLQNDNERLKKAAILSLAELGGKAAVKKLFKAVSNGSDTDTLIIQKLVDIKSQTAIEKLAELVGSQFVDIRSTAIDGLVKIGDKSIPAVTENLKSDNVDTIVHSLNILGRTGDVTALPAIQKLAYKCPDNPNVRFAIYETMEMLPSAKSAISLAQGLTDPVDHVRMAAAKAIDKNLSAVLIAGMKNMIEARDEQSLQIVGALIDSGADNAFNFLLESEAFKDYATHHLVEAAHPEVREHFLGLLKSKGAKKLAEQIRGAVEPEEKSERIKVVAVDDSKMMLKIYMRALHELGYDSDTFEFPAEAVEAVKREKPDILITDLNMPEINGIQLSQEIRKTYSSQQLPIIMITTQSDIAGQTESEEKKDPENFIEQAGINKVLGKPFQDTDLREAISSLLK